MRISKTGLFVVLSALALTAAPSESFAASRGYAGDSSTQIVSEAPPPAVPVHFDSSLALGTASLGADGLANFGDSSGTVVGNRAAALRDEVSRLRSSVNLNSNEFAIMRTSGAAGAVQYHSTVAAITARLQNGTTKSNPILLRQWEEADASLAEVTSSLNKLNALEVAIDADSSVATYLLGSIQAAFDLAGAVDEDHDQLKLLRDEVTGLVVQLDYLRTQTAADIQRQSSYLATERSNLQALAFSISRGEMLGNSLANRPVVVNQPSIVTTPVGAAQQAVQQQQPGAPMAAPQAAPMAPVVEDSIISEAGVQPVAPRAQQGLPSDYSVAPSTGHLLVLIRFNQPDVSYEQQLIQAVGQALERMPNAEFSVVAVTPSVGNSTEVLENHQDAKRNAEEVKRSLVQLGLSPSRITMANTQSVDALTPEVHVYIR